MESWIRDFGSDVLTINGQSLFCKACKRCIPSEKRFAVAQHVAGKKHRQALHQMGSSTPQETGSIETPGRLSHFSLRLCEAFVCAGIPLHKLEHEKLRDFFRDFTEHEIPSAVTLRLNYVKVVYHQTLDYIRKCVSDHPIWISIDETTDVTGVD